MSKETTAAQTVNVSVADLVAMMQSAMQTVLEEARKPAPLTEAQLAELQRKQEEREEGAERERERRHKIMWTRRNCTHHRRDGSCRAVFVKGCGDPNLADGTGSGNFMICQACQAIIRPGEEPKNYGGMDIFDTALFNRLFQEAGVSDIIY